MTGDATGDTVAGPPRSGAARSSPIIAVVREAEVIADAGVV
jgi:hypothetical protein